MNGQVSLFVALLLVLILSLSFHEWGHAYAAKRFGDRTAEMLGRLTINPIKHIDPMGLLMVIMVGFGYAKPVPTDPRNFNSKWAMLGIAAAGPFMNLLIAFVVLNLYALGWKMGWTFVQGTGAAIFVSIVAGLNLALMMFNLIPIGPLDGHYILPYFLSKNSARIYNEYNDRYGMYALLGLMLLGASGVPVFSRVMSMSRSLGEYLTIF
ncbi:MAG: site-2 protease family protein [Granulosicoccaceae bacterium]